MDWTATRLKTGNKREREENETNGGNNEEEGMDSSMGKIYESMTFILSALNRWTAPLPFQCRSPISAKASVLCRQPNSRDFLTPYTFDPDRHQYSDGARHDNLQIRHSCQSLLSNNP